MQIQGLHYERDYLALAEQAEILTIIDQQVWSNELKRRVQHYGYRYDYKSRSVDPDSMFLGKLPDWISPIVSKLLQHKLITMPPDQLIINDYLPGQGIASHIDCVPCFGDTVVSLSLGSSCVMVFCKADNTLKIPLFVEAGGLVIMQGEARYNWKHSIPGRLRDIFEGQSFERSRRVSLTFRNVIL